MWMLFAISSMILCAMGEILSKKIIQKDTVVAPFIVYFVTSICCFLSAIVMWLLHLGESGETPVRILIEHPLIMLSTASTFLATFFMFAAFVYIGVSVESVISGVSGVFLFLGLVAINTFTGKLASVKDLLVPGRLLPILAIIVLIFLLSDTDKASVDTVSGKDPHKKKKYSAMAAGILIMLLSCLFDASDSLIVSYCVADDQIGVMDYYIATNFMDIIFGLICFFIAMVKLKRLQRSYDYYIKKIPVLAVLGVLGICSLLTYLIGSGYDAVKLAMLYVAYPVVPLLGARLLLKERYTAKQYFCIFGIAIASIVFCMMDYV